jgi:hypothetical protein
MIDMDYLFRIPEGFCLRCISANTDPDDYSFVFEIGIGNGMSAHMVEFTQHRLGDLFEFARRIQDFPKQVSDSHALEWSQHGFDDKMKSVRVNERLKVFVLNSTGKCALTLESDFPFPRGSYVEFKLDPAVLNRLGSRLETWLAQVEKNEIQEDFIYPNE